MVLVGDGPEPADELDDADLGDLDVLLVVAHGVPERLDGREQQDRAEDEEGERQVLHHLGADGDEDAAQHERSDHAEQQHPLAQFVGHRERGKEQHEDEQVVDRQRLLDEEAGEEVEARDAP